MQVMRRSERQKQNFCKRKHEATAATKIEFSAQVITAPTQKSIYHYIDKPLAQCHEEKREKLAELGDEKFIHVPLT
jgi:hypothetical protein